MNKQLTKKHSFERMERKWTYQKSNISINNLDDLGLLLSMAIGKFGEPIFFIGVFAALYSSVIGNAIGFGYLITDSVNVIKSRDIIKKKPLNIANSKIYLLI